MKVTIDREQFAAAFSVAAAVAPSRSTKQVLQYVLFQADDDGATLVATDMEISVRLSVPGVVVESPCEFLLPVARMSSILRECTVETLTIVADGSKVRVTGKGAKFELQSQAAEEFPNPGGMVSESSVSVPIAQFREMIRRTIFATDTGSNRFALGGIKLELEGSTLRAVATDGRRLAKYESAVTVHGEPEFGSTIAPSRAMQLIDRVFASAKTDDTVRIVPGATSLALICGENEFSFRLVEGRFPKWSDVVSQRTPPHVAEIMAGPLYSAIRQAAIVASSESRGVSLSFGENNVRVSSTTAEVGSVEIDLPVSGQFEPMTITFDNRFLQDFLKTVPPEQAFSMEMTNADSAAHFLAGSNYLYLVMPFSDK